MQLQTRIPVQPQEPKIDYKSNVLLLGSCFAENIGEKFNYFKFQHTLNPYGIVFHPLVLERLISRCHIKSSRDSYLEKDIFQHNERFHSFDAHSTLSQNSKEALIIELQKASERLKTSIENASHIIITLGTAFGYVHKELGMVVANCHKLPQKLYDKKLFTANEVATSLKSICENVKQLNLSANIIFTISPVRHIKDGFMENTQSKAHLISAVHKTISETKNTVYFPSYEIMMDELRDYRFYDEDMLHPSQTAVNYIWEQFITAWLSQDAKDILKRINNIQTSLAHKPFNPSSDAHQKFLELLQIKIKTLQQAYPYIKF